MVLEPLKFPLQASWVSITRAVRERRYVNDGQEASRTRSYLRNLGLINGHEDLTDLGTLFLSESDEILASALISRHFASAVEKIREIIPDGLPGYRKLSSIKDLIFPVGQVLWPFAGRATWTYLRNLISIIRASKALE